MLEDLFQSSTSVSLLMAIVGLLVFHLFYSGVSSQDRKREPPGPKPLPLLGNLLQVDLKRLDSSLVDLSKKYGPVFTVYFGPKKVVVLAGYSTVRQALVNHAEEFGDREVTPIFYDFNKENGKEMIVCLFYWPVFILVLANQPFLFPGILFSNGDSWKEMRRFALSTLRDFGMGKRISEGRIIEECRYLIEEFEQHEGKAFDNAQTINYAASNIISAIMFGKRFEYKDPVFQAMVERDHESIRLTGTASILIYDMFPWLGPFLKNYKHLMKNVEDNKEQIRSIIADLKETLNPDMCRCFVDAFLTRKLNLEESEIENSYYHDENLVYSVMNLFAAGTDTTGNTLRWCLLFIAKYPHFQDQVYEELSRVVGSRQVRVDDRKNLPYTDAVIHEAQRLANIVPMAIPHKTSQDVTFQGYFIKEGTTVFPLLTSVLHGESEWESPHTFNPSHFLDKDGKFIRRDAFMAFSAGRRVCLGESLARMELFLFFTSLLQRFRFSPPPGVTEDELDLAPIVGFTLTPSHHELCVVSRQ
ncbi:cytochrome P450 2K1-like isoform X1 [Sebastes umbrosus]|uniref:cytochrome P450 2K1-like isoform X1 n=1 Tax=Sebastes umbrosus TaxID=72105 RepID=UPI00189DAE06|nr:cytochrome P450 2K1-like isoform X1 [Sebastes umbrosus]